MSDIVGLYNAFNNSSALQLGDILEMSRQYDALEGQPSSSTTHSEPSYLRKHAVQKDLSALDAEIRELDDEIAKRQALRADLVAQRASLLKQFADIQTNQPQANGKGKQRATIDYASEGWEWADPLRKTMKRMFNIDKFRLCQEACVHPSFPCCED